MGIPCGGFLIEKEGQIWGSILFQFSVQLVRKVIINPVCHF
jgi:hypothetical protein